jgi:hypothetical protein
MKLFITLIITFIVITTTAVIMCSTAASDTETGKPAPREDKEPPVTYQEYLTNGDLITATESETCTNADKPNWECKRNFRLYLTKHGAAEKTEVWFTEYKTNQLSTDLYGKEGQGITLKDVVLSDKKIVALYTAGAFLCVSFFTQNNNQFKLDSTVLVRKETPGFGEVTIRGYLCELGGNIHVLVEYKLGTQEMWRIDGDKPTLLWRFGEKDLEKRQKEHTQKDAQKPADGKDGAAPTSPDSKTTAPPAKDDKPAPPASDKAAKP